MELERTLFRVHERFLGIGGVKKGVNYCLKINLALFILFFPIFIFGNLKYINTSPCLKPYLDQNYNLTNLYAVYPVTSSPINQTLSNNSESTSDGQSSSTNETTDGSQIPPAEPKTENNQTADSNPTQNPNETESTPDLELPSNTTQEKPAIYLDDLIVVRVVNYNDEDLDWNNLNDTDKFYTFFEFSGTTQIVVMDPTIRAEHNFTVHNITLDKNCYSTNFFSDVLMWVLDYENIIISELIYSFPGYNRFMRNNITGEAWGFPSDLINNILQKENIVSHVSNRIFGILKLLFGLFLISNITALYNKMTIICAPIFILAAYNLCAHPSQRQYDRMNIFRAFPWIGMYLYTLNNNGRRKDRDIIFAYLCMIVIFYCLYLASLMFWNLILFTKNFPKGLDENFYGFLALLEFLVLLFLRTRTTLKFFPQMSVLLMTMFLYYVQYTPYGFYNMALLLMCFGILGIFAYFMLHFEIPAVDWNPSYHYTPSLDSPRTLYFPIFSLTWYHDIPQLWTTFFPMFGRSHFTTTELAMVNRNYPLLVTTLENASQGVRPLDDQGIMGGGGGNNNANNNNNQNNFGFGGGAQEMANVPPAQGNNNNPPNLAAPGSLDGDANANLLRGNNQNNSHNQNNESDYVLNISDERPNNNTRLLNWGQNQGGDNSQYRRIDDEA